ncbi:MAG: methyltransferase domain-containing protein [Candidatus Aegiribacteria sp.]|nr:methyltransferase domain-containing protein [Candidatus Aegiribacteria sp.]MBD3295661.1 methyltransferase domain-containing protein [Candidatus Fermentibacteria bacterium]
MKKTEMNIENVKEVYSGPEGQLWELIMGEQIHVGGWSQSAVLAEKAGIKSGQKVLDVCSALGAGLRFLERKYGIEGYGLDATEHMVEEAKRRTDEDGQSNSIEYRVGNAESIPWPDESFHVVWGEDAWCYVEDKNKLIEEARRVLKPGGTIAFSDWIEGPSGMDEDTALRICNFMKFPAVFTRRKYEEVLQANGFSLITSQDLTEQFADYVEFYIKMLTEQLYFDALKIIGWDEDLFQAMGGEMMFMCETARKGGFGRARIIAVKE